MHGMTTRYAGRLLLLFVLILCAHLAYNTIISAPTLELMVGDGYAMQVRKVDAALADTPMETVFYFGDSVNWHSSPDDSNKTSISGFLDEELADLDVLAVDHKAFHMGVYSSYAEYVLSRKQTQVAAMIVPINLRSFSTHFYRNWSWQFNDLQRFLRHDGFLYRLSFRPFKTFQAYTDSDITEETFMGMPVFDGETVVGKVHEYSGAKYHVQNDDNVRDKIVFYYMQSLDRSHERVGQLRKMAALCKDRGQKVIFYITPVDYKTCDRMLEGRFSTQIEHNVGIIKRALSETGHDLLDLSFALEPSYFYYGGFPLYPNEHLNENGRRWIASRIQVEMREKGLTKSELKEQLENKNE